MMAKITRSKEVYEARAKLEANQESKIPKPSKRRPRWLSRDGSINWDLIMYDSNIKC